MPQASAWICTKPFGLFYECEESRKLVEDQDMKSMYLPERTTKSTRFNPAASKFSRRPDTLRLNGGK
jgi:hypothetical protein